MNACWKVFLLIFFAFLGSEASADTYSYVDDRGTIVFTDNPSKIPRKQGKVRKNADEPGTVRPMPSVLVSPSSKTVWIGM